MRGPCSVLSGQSRRERQKEGRINHTYSDYIQEENMPTGIKIEGINFSEQALVDHPAHAAVLGRIFTSWSLIESTVTSLLGLMMHDDHRAALAILGSFRNNSSRVEVVRRIGREVLDEPLRQDFDGLMKDVLSYAIERNAIAHGLWGSEKGQPDLVYRMPMEVFSNFAIEAPNNPPGDVDALVQSFKDKMETLTVDDLLKIEQRGRNIFLRVMQEMTQKTYSRASKNPAFNSTPP